MNINFETQPIEFFLDGLDELINMSDPNNQYETINAFLQELKTRLKANNDIVRAFKEHYKISDEEFYKIMDEYFTIQEGMRIFNQVLEKHKN